MIIDCHTIEKTCSGCKHRFKCIVGNVREQDGKTIGDAIEFCEYMFLDAMLNLPAEWHIPVVPKGLCPKGGLLAKKHVQNPLYKTKDAVANYTVCADLEFDPNDPQVIRVSDDYDKGDDSTNPDNILEVLWWLDLDFFEKRRRTSIVTTDLVYEMLEL